MITALRSIVTRTNRRLGQAGAALVEYTLLVALIAAAAIAAITFLGNSANDTMCSAGADIATVGGTPLPAECTP